MDPESIIEPFGDTQHADTYNNVDLWEYVGVQGIGGQSRTLEKYRR